MDGMQWVYSNAEAESSSSRRLGFDAQGACVQDQNGGKPK